MSEISAWESDAAGTEELYASVPVAGADTRYELESRIGFGKIEVHVPSDESVGEFASLVDRDRWEFSRIELPVALEPLEHARYREVEVTITFTDPETVTHNLELRETSGVDSVVAFTRGAGRARATWAITPVEPSGRLGSLKLICLVQHPQGVVTTDLLVEAEAKIVKTIVVSLTRHATMKEPQRYRLSFDRATLTRLPGSVGERAAAASPKIYADAEPQDRTVIVFHGRNRKAVDEVFAFLRSIGLDPQEWNHLLERVPQGSPAIADVLDAAMKAGWAFLILMTPDDVVYLKPQFAAGDHDDELAPIGQARPNVLYEAGLAMGTYPNRTVLTEFGRVRSLTNLDGRYVIRLTNSVPSRQKLAQALRRAGCTVDLTGNRWQTAGDLTPPESDIPPPAGAGTVQSGHSDDRGARPAEPTSQDERLTFGNVTVKVGSLGRKVVHGEVTCNIPTLSFATLDAVFYDEKGGIVGAASGTISAMSKGQKKSFHIDVIDDMTGYAEVRIQADTVLP